MTTLDQRQQLIECATSQIAHHGYFQTTVSDIIEAAEVTEETFYAFFETKEDVVMSILSKGEEALLDVVKLGYRKNNDNVSGMVDSSIALFTNYFSFAKENRDLMMLMIRIRNGGDSAVAAFANRVNEDIEHAFFHNIQRAKDLGMLVDKRSTAVQAALLTSLVNGMMQRWLFANDPIDSISMLSPEDMAREIVQFEFFGFIGWHDEYRQCHENSKGRIE
ncbi:TetR/AcrR family transcriptional regulator [Aureibacillus halotolerans]|uniref:TetR family transcriptional regulator n=1 Tax=Aureibacillus halotolerans TaxID=1508390 RepID=A0A4V6PWI9_9BACI|nr:TetR/AcrR family transcriptional regulator [Aureibacillus halotolerans]TDQ41127.1 TetR family transcriptional regulator [Aureibacillus halotolerans]